MKRRLLQLSGQTAGQSGVMATIAKPSTEYLKPKQIVGELNRFIIGQDEAKRSLAVALSLCLLDGV